MNSNSDRTAGQAKGVEGYWLFEEAPFQNVCRDGLQVVCPNYACSLVGRVKPWRERIMDGPTGCRPQAVRASLGPRSMRLAIVPTTSLARE